MKRVVWIKFWRRMTLNELLLVLLIMSTFMFKVLIYIGLTILGLWIFGSIYEDLTRNDKEERKAIKEDKQEAISNLSKVLKQKAEDEARNNSKWLLFSYSNEHEVLGEYNTVEEYTDTLRHYKRMYKGKVCDFPYVGGYYGTEDKLYVHITHEKTMIMMREYDYNKRSSNNR